MARMRLNKDEAVLPLGEGVDIWLFPVEKILGDGWISYIDRDHEGTEWRKLVKVVHENLTQEWVVFYKGLGYVLFKSGMNMDSVCKMLGIYKMQIASDRIISEPLDRGLVSMGSDFVFNDGEEYRKRCGLMMGLYRGITEREYLRYIHLLDLFGVGWFKSFPYISKEPATKDNLSGKEFNNQVDWMYYHLGAKDRQIVDGYIRHWGECSERHKFLCSTIDPSKKDVKTIKKEKQEVRIEHVLAKIKSMSEWTEEDFWREMTELYVKCKTAEDVRSVKQILELKAKTMGLLEEKDNGGVNNFLMLTEKAVVALNGMGILGRRSVVHEQ